MTTTDNSRADALTDAVWRLKRDLERGSMGAGTCLVYMADLRALLAASPVEQPAAALTEKQRHAVDEAAKVLRDNWEHGTAEDLLMAFLPESSDPQPAAAPITSIEDLRDKWKLVDGDMREGEHGLITYHVEAFDEGLRAGGSKPAPSPTDERDKGD